LGKKKGINQELVEETIFELMKTVLHPNTPKSFMAKIKPLLC